MAKEIITSVYGVPPLGYEEQMRLNSINAMADAKVYLLKSIDKENDIELNEAMRLIVKIDKLEKKIKEL